MWSLTLPRMGRTSGAEKLRSSARNDFFDSIDPTATLAATRVHPLYHMSEEPITDASAKWRGDAEHDA
jgi:hypothetical protein